MALDIGRLLGDLATAGGTYFKRQKKAKKKKKEADALIAQNTELAQQQMDQDLGASRWEGVSADPAMRAAQEDALARMEALSRTGFSDTDRQALDQSFQQSRREEQGQRQAALSAAARRGDVSGGNALQAALMAQQGGADRAANFATDVGLAGRDRALQALENYGGMASQMRGQGVAEQQARAGGLDSFKQWATGQKFNAAQSLMNARMGQSQNLQAQAAQMQATPNLDAAGDAYLSYQTMGASGALGGGGSQASGQTPQQGAQHFGGSGTYHGTPGTGGTPWIPGSPGAGRTAQQPQQQGGASAYIARRAGVR